MSDKVNKPFWSTLGICLMLFLLHGSVAYAQQDDPKPAVGDLVIPRKEDGPSPEQTPPSIFPHWKHRIYYRCDACHDELFKMELGATDISMELMADGESCATCHNGELAFDTGFNNCNKCHQ